MNLHRIIVFLLFGVKLALGVTFNPMDHTYGAARIDGTIVVGVSRLISDMILLYLRSLSDPFEIYNDRRILYSNGVSYVITVFTQDLTAWGGGSDLSIGNLEALARYSRDYVNDFPRTLSMPVDAGMIMYSASRCPVAAIHYLVQIYTGRVNSISRGNVASLETIDSFSGNFTNVIPVPDPKILKMPPVPYREVQGVPETRQNANRPLGGGLCKRSGTSDMSKCAGADTIVSGHSLLKTRSLYSEKGARLYADEGGNLCLYVYDPNQRNYWCMNWAKPKTSGFKWRLTDDGALCRWESDGTGLCTRNGAESHNGRYRMTLQNDGNLVIYKGVYEKVIWSSDTSIFPHKGPEPCQRPVS